MSDRAELEALIRAQIEQPAFHRILAMVRTDHINQADAELFRTSAERYKEAALADYESFDPRVRHELRKSLLIDYQNEINRLIDDISARSAVTTAEPKPLDRSEQPDPPSHEQASTAEQEETSPPPSSSLLDKAKKYLFPGTTRPPK